MHRNYSNASNELAKTRDISARLAIQKFMDQERPTTEPFMDELRTISAEPVATQKSRNNENEGAAQRLAAKEARLLKQLMRANSRLSGGSTMCLIRNSVRSSILSRSVAKSPWWRATRARSSMGCDELWMQSDPAPPTRGR
jgi:hypothetical protein